MEPQFGSETCVLKVLGVARCGEQSGGLSDVGWAEAEVLTEMGPWEPNRLISQNAGNPNIWEPKWW